MIQRVSLKNKLLPDLVEIQRASFKWFLLEGLTEVLDFFPNISDPTSRLELQLFGKEYKIKFPRYSVRQAKSRDRTYSAQIYVPAKLTRKDIDLPSKDQNKTIKSLDLSSNHLQFSAEKQIKNKKYK